MCLKKVNSEKSFYKKLNFAFENLLKNVSNIGIVSFWHIFHSLSLTFYTYMNTLLTDDDESPKELLNGSSAPKGSAENPSPLKGSSEKK